MSKEIRDPKAGAPERASTSAAPAEQLAMHEEPTTGGSYTRNPETGALTKNEPAPAEEPSQE